MSPRKQTLYIVAKESTKSSTAFGAPTAKQILANGRGVGSTRGEYINTVSLSGFKYRYQQEYVSLVNRQLSHFCSLIFQTNLEMRLAAISSLGLRILCASNTTLTTFSR